MGDTKEESIEDALAAEAEELDGYFSDAPLDPEPDYPPLNENFDNTVVVLGLPRATGDKLTKIKNYFQRVMEKIGPLDKNDETGYPGFYMPLSGDVQIDESKDDGDAASMLPLPEEGVSMGFAFVTFQKLESVKQAVAMSGTPLRKNDPMTITPFTRLEQLKKLPRSFDEKSKDKKAAEVFTEKPNATKWLEDSLQRDQFVIRQGNETIVYWNDGRNDPVVDYDGSREKEAGVNWCDYYCHWSPKGSYLATLVPSKGVLLWCGPNYEKASRFVAPGVKRVLFSPQESYLITSNDRRDDPDANRVYHIPTGKMVRSFPLYPDNFPPKIKRERNEDDSDDDDDNEEERDYSIPPPPFLWSHDDKFLAQMGANLIVVYETPSMRILESKSLRAPGVREIQWSPKANVLACWSPEDDNAPAHVDLIEIPSREKLRQKNLFHVTNCNMVWHPDGDFLAVKVTRHTKSKKTFFNNIELFRLNEPGVPVEMLEIKDAVMALTWEPRGSRFAMIHAENPSSTKVNVSFYDMMKKQEVLSITKKGGKKGQQSKTIQRVPEVNLIETLEGRGCNVLFWSPAGQTILMASLGDSASGTLEFYDVDTKALVVKEHYRANQVMWDPAGRTVATCVTQPVEGGHFKFAMDNGYIIWSFQGKQIYQQSFETFYQLQWRPRETLLSKSQVQKVRKNLKKYEKQFEKADKERERMLYLEETKGKRLERKKYRDIRDELRALRKQQRERHIELLGGYDSEDDENYVVREITVETVLSTKEETVA